VNLKLRFKTVAGPKGGSWLMCESEESVGGASSPQKEEGEGPKGDGEWANATLEAASKTLARSGEYQVNGVTNIVTIHLDREQDPNAAAVVDDDYASDLGSLNTTDKDWAKDIPKLVLEAKIESLKPASPAEDDMAMIDPGMGVGSATSTHHGKDYQYLTVTASEGHFRDTATGTSVTKVVVKFGAKKGEVGCTMQ